jgi:hypothetical protein
MSIQIYPCHFLRGQMCREYLAGDSKVFLWRGRGRGQLALAVFEKGVEGCVFFYL